jgi:myosin heavy subunit
MPNENVIAMGIGLTEKPAADVKGIATKIEETKASETIVLEAPVKKVEKIISQSQETNVKTRRETNMKITSITDITDENLKQCTASSVTEFIQSELKKASESYVAEKQQQATANTKLQETTENLNKSVKEMKASLDTLQKEKADRDKVDSFNAHMSEVCASYELPEDVTKIVVDDLKSLATEEAFAAWKTKASTLLKSYSKAEAKAKKDKEAADKAAEDKADKDKADKDAAKASEDEMEAKKKTPKANIAIASAVEGALDNADKEKGGLPNTSTASAPGLKEKFAAAFAEDNFVITK